MAIPRDKIASGLTLEIDEEAVSIKDFKKATDHFFGLIKEVSKNVCGHEVADAWTVRVYEGSIGIAVIPKPSKPEMHSVVLKVIEGYRALSQGKQPASYSEVAIEHAKQLASLSEHDGTHVLNIRLLSDEEPVVIDKSIIDGAKQLLGSTYEEESSVDGILEKVDGHDKLRFVIYSVLDQHSVKCEFSEELLPQALANFKKRIEVLGKVTCRRDGTPIRIQVNTIVSYPDQSEIPTLDEMCAMLNGEAMA